MRSEAVAADRGVRFIVLAVLALPVSSSGCFAIFTVRVLHLVCLRPGKLPQARACNRYSST